MGDKPCSECKWFVSGADCLLGTKNRKGWIMKYLIVLLLTVAFRFVCRKVFGFESGPTFASGVVFVWVILLLWPDRH